MQRIWIRAHTVDSLLLFVRFLSAWRLFGCWLFGCSGDVPALPSHWWRHICAGRSGCSASIPAFMIARRCESRNTLYCTQTQKLMKLDCLPGHKFLNVTVCVPVCVNRVRMHEWRERQEALGRVESRGAALLKASSLKISSSDCVQKKYGPKCKAVAHTVFIFFATADVGADYTCTSLCCCFFFFLSTLTQDDRRSG